MEIPHDLNRREVLTLLYLLVWVVYSGVMPELFLIQFNRPGVSSLITNPITAGVDALVQVSQFSNYSFVYGAHGGPVISCPTGNCGSAGNLQICRPDSDTPELSDFAK